MGARSKIRPIAKFVQALRTCKITNHYDPKIVSYETLLDWLGARDPTTLNRQGADIGSQYRSALLPQ